MKKLLNLAIRLVFGGHKRRSQNVVDIPFSTAKPQGAFNQGREASYKAGLNVEAN
jgi:hypothetical protein